MQAHERDMPHGPQRIQAALPGPGSHGELHRRADRSRTGQHLSLPRDVQPHGDHPLRYHEHGELTKVAGNTYHLNYTIDLR